MSVKYTADLLEILKASSLYRDKISKTEEAKNFETFATEYFKSDLNTIMNSKGSDVFFEELNTHILNLWEEATSLQPHPDDLYAYAQATIDIFLTPVDKSNVCMSLPLREILVKLYELNEDEYTWLPRVLNATWGLLIDTQFESRISTEDFVTFILESLRENPNDYDIEDFPQKRDWKMSIEDYSNSLTLESDGFKGQRYQTDDHTLYCEIAANSLKVERTFVLAHGVGATGRYMKFIANEILSTIPDSKVVILDLAFHGESTSTCSIQDMTIEDYTDYAADFIDHLDDEIIGNLNWVGWSLGGSIGLLLELRGDYIDELVLINSAPHWPGAMYMRGIPAMQEDATAVKGLLHLMDEDLYGLGSDIKLVIEDTFERITSRGHVIRADFSAIEAGNYNVRSELGDIVSKTLVIGGRHDILAPEKLQEEMARSIPTVRLKMLEFSHATVLHPKSVILIVDEIKDFFI